MIKLILNTDWGLNTEETAKSDALWGARTVVEGGSFSLVYDRQDWKGSEESKSILKGFIALHIDKLKSTAITLMLHGKISNKIDNEIVLFDDENFKVIANTRGSHGYLYITAFLKGDDK